MLKSFPLPVKKFPLLEDFPTASEKVFPLLSQRDAPAEEVCTAKKLKVNRGQRHIYNSQRRVLVILGRQYTRRARIAQSSALPTIADEPASPVRDV
nr:hypothetical protein [Tanacetum cinerariifolium]